MEEVNIIAFANYTWKHGYNEMSTHIILNLLFTTNLLYGFEIKITVLY